VNLFTAWLRVARLETGSTLELVRLAIFLGWRFCLAATTRGLASKTQRLRRLEVCRSCPIYNAELRSCRPHVGSPYGCGCFTDFLVWLLLPHPPKPGCWAKQNLPEASGLGW
jgi:hypothetical protein